MDVLILLAIVIVFSLAAWKWGADGTERLDSAEWKRRQVRATLHGV